MLWQTLVVVAWDFSSNFGYIITNKISIFLADHWTFETEPMLWALDKKQVSGRNASGELEVTSPRIGQDSQARQVKCVLGMVVGLVKLYILFV